MTRRLRSPAVALGVGALVGLVVAGGGARLAMRIVALADDREDFGLPTEGGDIVGEVNSSRLTSKPLALSSSFGGREVKTRGHGMLALFDGTARALHGAATIREAAIRQGLQIRAGVHVGDVEFVGADVRGIAVREAARIMASASPDEILLSDLTCSLAGASDLAHEDRRVHSLKGLDGEWHLWTLLRGVQ